MRLSIILFDGYTTLDIVGGYEVLSRVPGVDVEIVAEERGVVAADTRRLGILAYRAFDEVRSTDILYVPGGPGAFALERNERFLGRLRALDATSTCTFGVCNGVGLLAAAGLLQGRAATTNWFYRERLATYGVALVARRYHRDGKYVTGAGVSASIDAGLHLAQLIAGDTVAQAIQLGIEYYPEPPYPEKTPADAPASAQQIVRRHEAIAGEQQLQLAPAWGSA